MKKILYLLPAGVAVLLLAVVVSTEFVPRPKTARVAVVSEPSIVPVGRSAFGALSASAPGSPSPALGAAPAAADTAIPAPSSSAPVSGMGGGGFAGAAVGTEGKMVVRPDWHPVTYTYAYKGDPLELSDETVTVFRRVKGDSALPVPTGLRDAMSQLLDLGSLSSSSLQSFAVTQDKEFGYIIYADLAEGAITVSRNWMKWPQDQSGVSPSEMPSNEEAIDIAKRGLSAFGIDASRYGAPEIQNDWRIYLAAAEDKASFRAPESVSIVFPTVVDGLEVRDSAGTPFGLVVSVNARQKMIDGIFNLMTQRYESSPYDAETDAKRIIGIAERGGTMGGWVDPSAEKVELQLGTPERILTMNWRFVNGGTEELLVPALRFPVLNPPKDFSQTSVVVPLAKELLQEPVVGVPEPVPLEKSTR